MKKRKLKRKRAKKIFVEKKGDDKLTFDDFY